MNERVIVALSGGVDSAVAALLLRLIGLFEHGHRFIRTPDLYLGEAERIVCEQPGHPTAHFLRDLEPLSRVRQRHLAVGQQGRPPREVGAGNYQATLVALLELKRPIRPSPPACGGRGCERSERVRWVPNREAIYPWRARERS